LQRKAGLGPNKNSSFKNISQIEFIKFTNAYFAPWLRKIQTKLSSSNKTLMLVQKAFRCKGPDGKVVFIPVVPGDVVDVQTFKKRKAYYEGKRFIFMNFQRIVWNQLRALWRLWWL
jgi:hypothetical protein